MRTLLYICLSLSLISCNENPHPEYKKIEDYYYKVHELGDEQKVVLDKYIRANLMINNLNGDTIHYVPDYPYFLKMDSSKIAHILCNFHLGDSISIIIDQKELKEYFNFFHLSNDGNFKALMHLRIRKIYSSANEALKEKEQYLKQRKIEQQKALMEIIQLNSSQIEEMNGIYREMIEEGDSTQIKFGSIVDMHYRGKFTNGYVFDDTYERNQLLSFTYGKQQQVLKGVDFGIKDMKKGNKFKIYIPSQLGFGSKGSLAGIVPPNTSIIYEIEIINVRNQ